ncbi:partner of Y14 and mago-like [Lineus longissimus]|uniref:partner of Y14 and mago-like n=1 Tax=Lineus longissimus TaxID=88925 RepID=UPI002B4F827C
MAANVSREGVVRDEKGDMYLPATQRPDGTWRKPIRVKDGYVPQEEMPVYENKGVQWLKSKPACPGLPVGYTQLDVAGQSGTASSTANMSKSAKKNAKRKEKKKQQKPEEEDDVTAITSVLEKAKIGYKGPKPPSQERDDGPKDPEKKLKSLRKKLRQIEDLEEKIQSGALPNPEKEQLAKISKKQQILDEIEVLIRLELLAE